MLRERQEFKRENIIFEKEEEKRGMEKNLDAKGIKNRRMIKVYWKILEYNTAVLEDNTESLKVRRGKNMVWEDKEVGLFNFWKRNRKIAKNGMSEMENEN